MTSFSVIKHELTRKNRPHFIKSHNHVIIKINGGGVKNELTVFVDSSYHQKYRLADCEGCCHKETLKIFLS